MTLSKPAARNYTNQSPDKAGEYYYRWKFYERPLETRVSITNKNGVLMVHYFNSKLEPRELSDIADHAIEWAKTENE